jgi:hypothetical protein
MKIPTDPDEYLAFLSEFSASLHDGLDAGSLHIKEYFTWCAGKKKQPVELNRPIATNLVRYQTLLHLVENRKLGALYHFEELANNGISIRFDWGHVKVYKGMQGEPPTAHNTIKNRDFYSQDQPKRKIAAKLSGVEWDLDWQHASWEEVAPTLNKVNLIYCWEVDAFYNITRVQLFCPRKSGKYKQGVKLFWRREIPHPIFGLAGIPTVNDFQAADDLPVFFEDAAEQGDDE